MRDAGVCATTAMRLSEARVGDVALGARRLVGPGVLSKILHRKSIAVSGISRVRRGRLERVREASRYLRPVGLSGIEALHARFVRHSYRPHSHPTWTVAVVEAGAARFSLDATRQQARAGEIFVLEPEAVHTGTAALPEGWAYKVLYVPPDVLREWAQAAGAPPGGARWVVFRDPILWARLLSAHAALAGQPLGLGVDVPVAEAVAALRPHLRGRERDASLAPLSTRPSHGRSHTCASDGIGESC